MLPGHGGRFLLMAFPLLFMSLRTALVLDWGLGFALLTALGLGASLGRGLREKLEVILEYVLMGALAAALCYIVGEWVSTHLTP